MLKIGQYNDLAVAREVEFGLYLADEDGNEVLLPRRYVTSDMKPGTQVHVFIYTDSDDRPVATTDIPFATAGEFAYLQVRDVNATGAFLDWGLPKDLLVPFSQQKSRMSRGGIYLVYVYLDHATMRVVASAKVEKFLGNALADYKPGQRVKALIVEHTPIGYRAIVDDRHWGMIYENEIFSALEIEQQVDAFVKQVRDDGKVDLTLSDIAKNRVADLSDVLLAAIRHAGGELPVSDESSPEQIREMFACSKKDFKKAVGHLYKTGQILLGEGKLVLAR